MISIFVCAFLLFLFYLLLENLIKNYINNRLVCARTANKAWWQQIQSEIQALSVFDNVRTYLNFQRHLMIEFLKITLAALCSVSGTHTCSAVKICLLKVHCFFVNFRKQKHWNFKKYCRSVPNEPPVLWFFQN